MQPERLPSGIYINQNGYLNQRNNSSLRGTGRIFNLD